MSAALRQVIARNRAGAAVALPSVCSAHPEVLRACLMLAEERDRPLLIEATSNQVNQEGGYSGMRPADFIALVHRIADAAGVDRARIGFGGDHLGPQAWKALPAAEAMVRAERMVADYVRAGFAKIHLDCSEPCADDPSPPGDALAAERSARLAAACRAAAERASGGADDLLYVIGTEVPVPGGARGDDEAAPAPTTPAAARRALEAHEAAFAAAGLADETARVAALVVQPGVEFGPLHVHHLPERCGPGLRDVMLSRPGLCLEAHSTDFQKPAAHGRLATLGFAVQKIGPALTFAWRRALYALDEMRVAAGWGGPILKPAMERLMRDAPGHWQGHYRGDAAALRLQRHHGFSDRIRYYWPHPRARAALAELREDLAGRRLPEPLLCEMFAPAVLERAEALSGPHHARLVDASVQEALLPCFLPDEDGARKEAAP